MIIKTISKWDFIQEFETSTERKSQFTYNALSALYDCIDDTWCDSEPFVFDMIAICCEFMEYNTIKEAAEDYNITPDELKDNTLVIECANGHVVVQQY